MGVGGRGTSDRPDATTSLTTMVAVNPSETSLGFNRRDSAKPVRTGQIAEEEGETR